MRPLRIAVILGAAAVMALLTLQTLRTVAEPPDPSERKITDAKRFLYYEVTKTAGPELLITGTERELQLVTHALLPGPPPFDPTRQVVYGLRVTLVASGKELWTRDVYTRSRQSKARRAGDLWLDESVFSLERGSELTDERLIILRLPEEAKPGASLRMRLLSDDVSEGLVRVYQRVQRAPARMELRMRSLSPAVRAELADDLSFTPWDRLDAAERNARLRFQRDRMSAIGREGEDYKTRAAYVTDFRLPIEEDPPLVGTLVMPTRAAAFNLAGPVELRLDVTRGPADTPSFVPVKLVLHTVGEGGQPPDLTLPVPPAPTMTSTTIFIPAGLHSLQMITDAQEGVRVLLAAPAGAQAQFGVPVTPGAAELLAPHQILLPGHLLDKDSAPLDVDVVGPDDTLTRILRFDARLVPPDAALPGTAIKGAVTLDWLDDKGRRLERQNVPLESVISAFEEVQAQGTTRVVAEPTSFRLIVPRGTRRVEVHAAQATLLRAHALITFTPEPDQLAPPFDAVQLQATTWRYAPFDERSWIPIVPSNREALRPLEARLAAQVRLEPAPAPAPPPGSQGMSIVPEGQPEKQTVLERVRPDEMTSGWQPGYHVPLRPGKPVKLKFSGPAAAKIQAWVLAQPELSLGHDVHVSIDGAEVAAFPITATRATWQLPDVPFGVHTVTVATDVNSLRLLIDQPPAGGGGEIVAARTVFQVGRQTVHLKAVKPSTAPAGLDMIIYDQSRDGDPKTQFRVVVDGGNPRRVEGVALQQITPAARLVSLPPADRDPIVGFADLATRTVYHPRLIAVMLGDDVGAGAHTVTITPLKGSQTTWMRFFIMTTSKVQPEKAITWRLLPSTQGVARE